MLLWAAVRLKRAGRPAQALLNLGCLAIMLIYAGFYNVGLTRVPNARPFFFAEGLVEGVKTAAQSIGPAAAYIWPYSGVIAVLLLVASLSAIYRNF